jgi:hypothetical protein
MKYDRHTIGFHGSQVAVQDTFGSNLECGWVAGESCLVMSGALVYMSKFDVKKVEV